ncbi:MAG: ATP-binding protein [Firmicutes bacterium]|nr:ATP-binding protein [Bacillota bacterium]
MAKSNKGGVYINEFDQPQGGRFNIWRRLSLTAKTTIVFSGLFSLIMTILGIIAIISVSNAIDNGEIILSDDFRLLRTFIWIFLLTGALAIVATIIGAIASTIMLRPIRKIVKQIDNITEADLSVRLDEVDSQTELRQLTNRINGMLDTIERAFVRQRNFVTDSSHELRTPIAVLQGYANLLKRWGTEKPDVLEESVEAIYRESHNMQRIVEQLSMLARLGWAELKKTTFYVGDPLEEVVTGYKMTASKHNITYNQKTAPPISADKHLLVQAVRAIIDNAVKYTPEGGDITVNSYADNDDVVIEVVDTGEGISKEDLPKVFGRFYRCDKARERKSGSSGLGLSIARSIIDLHHGTISAESQLGVGSKFIIKIKGEEE